MCDEIMIYNAEEIKINLKMHWIPQQKCRIIQIVINRSWLMLEKIYLTVYVRWL